MLMLVCYDIADARRLRKVARVMLAYGNRVQKSVFECHLNEAQQNQMLNRVRAVLNVSQDTVRLYRLCRACQRERLALGCKPVEDLPEVFVI